MGGKRRLSSEVVEVGTMGGWNSEELASSEVVGLDKVVLQSRMRRAYARLSSLNLALAMAASYHLLGCGMPAGVDSSLACLCLS